MGMDCIAFNHINRIPDCDKFVGTLIKDCQVLPLMSSLWNESVGN